MEASYPQEGRPKVGGGEPSGSRATRSPTPASRASGVHGWPAAARIRGRSCVADRHDQTARVRERLPMTTARRSALVFAMLLLLAIAALPGAAGAATSSPQLELGLPSPAFVEALHDPIVSLGLGRLPSPVEVSVGARVTARAARADLPSAYNLVDLGRVATTVKDQRALSTCWSFANIAALESKILSAQGQDLQRGQRHRAQRLLVQHRPAVRLRRLRLHGRGLLRPLGWSGHRSERPVWSRSCRRSAAS